MKRLVVLLATALLLCSCANKAMTRYETIVPVLKKEGFEGAAKKIESKPDELYGEKSEWLYHFDLGTLYHYNGDYKESTRHFEKAEDIYDDLFTKSVTNEAAAVVTNDNIRPYRARPFEIIMMYQYQILNYLAMKDVEGALVEVKRAQIALEGLYQKDQNRVNDNGFLRYLCAIVYEMSGEDDDAAISYIQATKAFDNGNIKMPSEAWQFINESLAKMDRKDDLKSMNRTPLEQTPIATEAREKGQEIIVIGYAGHSPILGEMYMSGTFVSGGSMHLNYKDGKTGSMGSITLIAPPVPNGNGGTFHIGFALPEKKELPQRVYKFNVKVDDRQVKPEKFVSVDAELDKNIEEETPTTITRTAVRVTIRTIAAQIAKEKTNTDNGIFNLLKNIAVDVGQSQLEQADLRIGLFMPNSVYMTRIPVDAGEHSVSVNALGNNGQIFSTYDFGKVKVGKGQKKVLIAPAIE